MVKNQLGKDCLRSRVTIVRKKLFKASILLKIIIIVVGSVVAAYGITLALYAGFGGATLAVLWQGISKTFHVSIGMASMIVAIIMIVFAFFYDRSQIQIGTILYQIVYSFVSICLPICMCTVRIYG